MTRIALAAGTCLAALLSQGCVVAERCFKNEDCRVGEVCAPDGRCVASGRDQGPLPDGRPPIICTLPGMVKAAEAFCIDAYEASRPDATESSAGSDGSRALSRKGALPWQVMSNAEADAACKASGKRLCTPTEWQTACQGPKKTAYAYGDSYDAKTCNGIDSFGEWEFKLMPTGSFAGCTNAWGVFDINGNVWEHVAGGSDTTIRGGAYNCSDSKAFHRCDYIPGNWTPSARGFRCCADGLAAPVDAGVRDAGPDRPPADQLLLSDQACIDVPWIDAKALDAAPPDSAKPDASTDAPLGDQSGAADGPTSASCPPEMASIEELFCMDRHEASRPDATAVSAGSDGSKAASKKGVLPWQVASNAEAAAACQAAGKRLCTPAEWQKACQGAQQTVYCYGNTYQAATCNGIDAFPSWTFHLTPTGDFPGCVNTWGVFDLNGNVWEHVAGGTNMTIRGGAFNCGDSVTYHRCDYIPGNWTPSAQGFRCCKNITAAGG